MIPASDAPSAVAGPGSLRSRRTPARPDRLSAPATSHVPHPRRFFLLRRGFYRRTFRWCGRGTALAIGAFLCAFLYVNQIGLPDLVKGPLLEQLRERGAELEFSRMRLRLGRGIVVEHVNLGRARGSAGEQVFADQLQLQLRWSDLLGFQVPAITAVTLRGGRLAIPVVGAGAAPFVFTADAVEARIRFVSQELWELEKFEGDCHGGTFRAAGSVTNASLLRRRSDPKTQSDLWKQNLLRIGRTLERTTFTRPPALDLAFYADLRDPARSTAGLRFTAAGAKSEFGKFEGVELSAELNPPPGTNGPMRVTLRLDATGAQTPWAEVGALRLDVDLDGSATNALPSRVAWGLALAGPVTRWGRAESARLDGKTLAVGAAAPGTFHSDLTMVVRRVDSEWGTVGELVADVTADHAFAGPATHWVPSAFSWSLRADQAASRWARASAATVSGTARRLGRPVAVVLPAQLALLKDWSVGLGLAVTNVVSPKLELAEAGAAITWSEEGLSISGLRARLYGGRLAVDASVGAADLVARAKVRSDFDLHRIGPLLGPATDKWLANYGWQPERPVELEAEASVALPVWTGQMPDWKGDVLPTLRIAGIARATNFSYRGVTGTMAVAPFAHTNGVWHVVGATAARPEGRLDFDLTERSATKDYRFRIRSSIDPRAALPLLGTNAARAMTNLQLTLPPFIDGEVTGRWREPERTVVRASVALTNFVVRGEAVDELRVREVAFTNGWLRVSGAELRQGAGRGDVGEMTLDLAAGLLRFTNTVTTLDPRRVTRAIGPKTARALEPYIFAVPPHVVLNGTIPVRDNPQEADVRFETLAESVRWWRLVATNLSATVWWKGQSVILTNLDSGFHGGRLTGNLLADCAPVGDAVLRFDAAFSDVQLRSLLSDIVSRTNRIEGLVTGRITVTEAHTRTNGAWTGTAAARMLDGFLWDLPLFGGVSGALDTLSPGLGQTRFSSGSGTFTIADRLVRTSDLEFRSPSMRLGMGGTVDFETRLAAVLHAEPLRDLPLLGAVFNLAISPFTKLMEYDVRGTLGRPVTELRYVPDFLLIPLRPIQTIKGLFTPDPVRPPVERPPEGKRPTAP